MLKGIPGIVIMIVDAATAEKTCARHGKNVLKNIKPNAPKPPKAVAAATHKVVEAAAVIKAVEAAAAHKVASLPHANKPKKHGPSALRNIKPNAPKPPKVVEAAAAHKAVATVAAHSNDAPRVMTFAKPLPSASSNLPNPAKK